MMLCQFFSFHKPFHIRMHNIEEYKRTLMTTPLNNDHLKLSNSPILIFTWKYIRINIWYFKEFCIQFSTWTIRLMPWTRIQKRKINIFYPNDRRNQNYYLTLFQSLIFYIDTILRKLILAPRVLSGKNPEKKEIFQLKPKKIRI